MMNPFKMMGRAVTETARTMATIAENPVEGFKPTTWVKPMVETARAGMEFDKGWASRDLGAHAPSGTPRAQGESQALVATLTASLGLGRDVAAALTRVLTSSPSARAVVAGMNEAIAEDPSPARQALARRLARRMVGGEQDNVFDQISGAMFTTTFGFMMPGGGPRPRRSADAALAGRAAHEVEALEGLAADRNFVFVGGFGGEHLGDDYFAPTRDVLDSLGARTVSKIQPSSIAPIEDNVEHLVDELLTRYHLGDNQPLTVIAHSKGGAETMLALLQNPDLVRLGIVKDVVVVQGAVKGTPAAKSLLATMSSPATMLLPPAMVGAAVMDPAVRSLQADVRSASVDRAMRRLSPEDRDALNSSVRYVRSAGGALPGAMSQNLARSMRGAHDGLLPYDAQRVSGLGEDIDVPGANAATHMDLVYDDKASKLSTSDKHAASIAMLLGLV